MAIAAAYAVIAALAAATRETTPAWWALTAGLAAVLVALSTVDLATYRLPDALTYPLMAAGLIIAGLSGHNALGWHLASAVAGFLLLYGVAGLYRRLRGHDGLGLGDAKLLAAAGAWLGAEALPSVLLWACAAALVWVLASALLGRPLERTTRLPFGPALALGFWVIWLFGPLS